MNSTPLKFDEQVTIFNSGITNEVDYRLCGEIWIKLNPIAVIHNSLKEKIQWHIENSKS